MTVNLLASIFENFGENALWGVFTLILGVVVVFLGMTILVLAVTALGKIITPKKKTKTTKEETDKPKDENTVAVNDNLDEIPEEVRVAIVAAITAFYFEGGSKNEFRVKKIKKI